MKRALVLCVEDDEPYAEALNRALKREEVDVILATNAGEAEEQLRSRRSAYDAVVLDLGLSDSAGIDTFQRIAIAMGSRKIPVVVVTASIDTDTQRRLFHAGARDVLLKDMGIERIVRAIQAACRAAAEKASDERRKESPVPGGGLSPDWIKYIIDEGARRTGELIDDKLQPLCLRVAALESPVSAYPKRKRKAAEAIREEWPSALKEVAKAAVIIAGTFAAVRGTNATPAQAAESQAMRESAQAQTQAQQDRQWRTRGTSRAVERSGDAMQGQRGSASADAQEAIAGAP